MPLILPGNVGSATAATGYNVANSCRFNDDDSAYMHFTPGSGNRRTFTISMWVKRAKLGEAYLWGINNGTNPYTQIVFDANDKLYINDYNGSEDTQLITTQTFRDVAAWYHIVIAYDTTQSTAANRVKLYINGTRVTSFATETYPAQNFDTEWNNGVQQDLGKFSTSYGDYYLAEVCMVEDSQLAPTSFGEFDEDSPQIWKPIDVSGLTFNTEGFYLDFEDSGDLGDDESGNGNDFTEVNLAATDQTTDTCTNNFCTINSLDNFYEAGTLAEGNCKYTANTGRSTYITSTFGVSSGRWYYEVLCSEGSNSYKTVGFTPTSSTATNNWFGEDADHVSYYHSGKIYNGGTADGTYGSSWAATDILGCYLDLTSNKAYFTKNGAIQNSGTGYDISGSAFDTGPFWFCTVGMPAAQSPGTVLEANFGNPPFAISSSVSDDNGYGSFEYSPNITGDGAAKKFYAICTKNIAEFG